MVSVPSALSWAGLKVNAPAISTSSVTVTTHCPVEPCIEVAVMVALPIDIAVTNPVSDTLAISGAELDHLISLFVAFSGNTVAESCAVSSTANVREDVFILTPRSGTNSSLSQERKRSRNGKMKRMFDCFIGFRWIRV